LLPVAMCVEQQASASLYILSTRSTNVTHEISQTVQEVRASELNIDDTRLPDLQQREHAEHVRVAFSQRRKQRGKARLQLSTSTSEKRAALIDKNAVLLAEKLRAFRVITKHKRKAHWAERCDTKKRRVTIGKYKLRKVQPLEKASFLWCFNRRGGPGGLVHTHVWRALV
jgi:hypothetical protein